MRETKAPDATANHVLRVLASYADEAGECYPSLRTLADQTQLNKATVCRALDRLEAAGLIRRMRGDRLNATHYLIDLSPSATDTLSHTATMVVAQSDATVAHNNDRVAQSDRKLQEGPIKIPATTTLSADAFVEGWNALAPKFGLAQVKKLTDARKRKLSQRLKDSDFSMAIVEDWVIRSQGVHGTQWFSFDWILSEGNYAKLIEGKYLRKFGENGNGNGHKKPESFLDRKMREIREAEAAEQQGTHSPTLESESDIPF